MWGHDISILTNGYLLQWIKVELRGIHKYGCRCSERVNRTVTDRLIKKPSHEDFVVVWSEAVFGKGLTFDFFTDPLVHKAIL